MKNNKYILICIVLCTFIMQGCDKWLDVKPTDRQTEAQTFSSKGGFYSAMNGIYNKLNSESLYGGELSYNMVEVIGQRYTIASVNNKAATAFQAYKYTDDNAKAVIKNVWETTFKIILNCNIVLRNVELRKEMLGEKDYSIIKGEMLAVRAFLHFDMLRLFGPIYSVNPDGISIPYTVSAEGEVTDLLPASQIIKKILTDIDNSEKLLKNFDPVVTDGRLISKIDNELSIYNDENIYGFRQLRFNYYAVSVLKARVQLYMGDKQNALTTAKSIINSETIKSQFPAVTSSDIVGNNTNPDRMLSTEVFFGMYDKNRNLVNKERYDPETAGSYLLQPRPTFVESVLFANMSGDYRLRGQWVIPSTSDNTNRTIGKYKDIKDKLLFHATFVPLIRFSEMYLIAAECEPDVVNGLAHLNYLRVNMRGNIGSPLENITTNSALNDEILKEYSREFYGEGQMFYYYKRRNINIPGTNNGYNTSTYGFANRADRAVLPLPESETLSR